MILAPDVGALVDYKDEKYRVSGWVCEAEAPSDWVGQLLFDSAQLIEKRRMRFCSRKEATHVSLSGVCGAIAHVETVTVTGRVPWPEEHIARARKSAEHYGQLKQVIW